MERGLDVFIGIVCEEKMPTADVVRNVLEVKGVQTVYELTGNFDIIVRASSHSASELNKIIERVRACEGIVSSTTYLVLARHDNR